jgi:hypothetical protein
MGHGESGSRAATADRNDQTEEAREPHEHDAVHGKHREAQRHHIASPDEATKDAGAC